MVKKGSEVPTTKPSFVKQEERRTQEDKIEGGEIKQKPLFVGAGREEEMGLKETTLGSPLQMRSLKILTIL